jgi:recombination protein RecA
MATEKEKAVELAIEQIKRQYGKGPIMRLGEAPARTAGDVISIGALALDLALGVEGIPNGRMTEILGSESSGKTTLAQHAFDPAYAANCGVNLADLLISQPDTGEQALEMTETLVRSGAVDVVIIASVAALAPRAEIEGEINDAHVGLQARLMSQALRRGQAPPLRSGSNAQRWQREAEDHTR